MNVPFLSPIRRRFGNRHDQHRTIPFLTHSNLLIAAAALALAASPAIAFAQSGGSPFDTGFTALQTLFTGTIAKVASLGTWGQTGRSPQS